ncbi:BMA_0021/BMA_0022 family TOMM bacteriocin [Sorangium sp. So ce448]|uniref:BMA_0021/BMA_0022 family TOMM bacteriocin n=1 Tax=Sorangium sp. So ce448 TaxID=3133314 RepID=UPI003F620D7F
MGTNTKAWGGGGGSAAPFPHLRAAYLRAIAHAWRDSDFLKLLVKESKENPQGVLPLFEKEYNIKFPYNVKFAIADVPNRPEWRPVGTTGWFGVADEFHITLPGPPPPAEPGAPSGPADAIALYCEWFPSMLGKATDGVSEAPDDFAEFGVITARILALTWFDQAFARKLYDAEDARPLVQASMGVVVRWNFRLKFCYLDWEQFWAPSPLLMPPRTTITVYVPKHPPDEAAWPIALAAYNDTGPQYPFTCA